MKNIVFDIGNVLLKWSPLDIVKTLFPLEPNPDILAQQIFKSQIWYDLNLGKLTEEEAIFLYRQEFPTKTAQLKILMEVVKKSLVPLQGSLELLNRAYQSGRSLYSITDNVKEIIVFLKKEYDFFEKFQGIIVSADVGLLKPNIGIYRTLLDRYGLQPSETIFMDDVIANVEGARQVGMYAIHFTTAEACEGELRDKFGISF